MNSSKTSNSNFFFALAAVTLVTAAFACVALRNTVDRSGGWGIIYDETRVALQPSNQARRIQLVRDELEADLTDRAVRDLPKACHNKFDSMDCAEVTTAVWIVAGAPHNVVTQTPYGFVTNSEAARAFAIANGPLIAQAQELFALGLPRSSQRIAVRVPQPSVALYELRGELETAVHGDGGADAALADYRQALKLDPSSKTVLTQALAVSRQTANDSLSSNYEVRLKALNSN